MKLIFKIARTELRNLFYSPIAWFLTIAFLVQCGFIYTIMLGGYASAQEMGGLGLQYITQLTIRIFAGQGGLFSSVMQNLYLYIPLLTMGLISREVNGGTISLLYSSPVKVGEIVFGKYMAMMLYSLLLVAVVAVFMVSGVFHIKSADTGILWSAALGFYLLLCAYSAIGLFMSCLTSYQVVAAISTFVMIGILSYIGGLWQGIDFVRDLTYFLSINGRTGKMLIGLITTKDVVYFIVVIYIFLAFSVYKLQSDRASMSAFAKASRYAVIVILALVIGYISSRPGLIGYWDTTVNNSNTLTRNAQNIIKELGDDPLEITVYNNLLGDYYYLGTPEERNDFLSRWESYVRFKPDIKFAYVNYYDTALDAGYDMFRFYPGKTMKQIAEQKAKAAGLKMNIFETPAEIRKMIDLRPELNRFVMQLKYRGRSTFLRIFNDTRMWPSETEVSAAFKRLLQAKMPKVVFLAGNAERNINRKGDREYRTLTNLKTFRYALLNQGFDVDTLSLDSQDIPLDISALVIADPKTSLSINALNKIQQYIDKGGNLLIAGEPGRQELLNPVLKSLGVQLTEGMLEQKSEDFSPSLLLPHLTKFASAFSKTLSRPSVDTLPVSMVGSAGLVYNDTDGFTVQPLLETNGLQSWNSSRRNPDLDLSEDDNASQGVSGAHSASFVTMGASTAVSVAVIGGSHSAESTGQPENNNRHVVELDGAEKDSLRVKIHTIMTGNGTQEEKKKKVAVLIDSVMRKMNHASSAAASMKRAPAEMSVSSAVSNKAKSVNSIALPAAVPDNGGKQSFSTALALTRKINGKEQRIIVTGDADFMSNSELSRNNVRTANFFFSTALFSWLDNGQFPIDTSRPDAKDNRVSVSSDAVSVLKIIYVWVLPAILLVFGSVLLIRRKRK